MTVVAPNLMIQQPEPPALIRHPPCESLPHTNLTPPFTRIFKFVDFISDSREPLGIGTIFPPPPQPQPKNVRNRSYDPFLQRHTAWKSQK